MPEFPSSVDENLLLLDDLEAFSKYAEIIVSRSRRHLAILSDTLDFPLYDNAVIENLVSTLARSDRNAEVRILVKDIRPLIERNHQLLQLARRLPSKVKLRRLDIEPENNDRAYLIGDTNLLLYRHDEREYVGFANFNAAPEVAKIMDDFNYLWQRHSVDDPELRCFTL